MPIDSFQYLLKPTQFPWSYNEVKLRKSFQQLGAFHLGETANHANDKVRIPLLDGRHPAKETVCLLFRFGPHSAGIYEYEIGLVWRVYRRKAVIDQKLGQIIRVIVIHLTTHGLNIEVPKVTKV